NGNEVYTRNGNIQQDDQGQLTIDGNLVLGDNGPIILPPNAIASFGSDGTLSVTPDDGDGQVNDVALGNGLAKTLLYNPYSFTV
ncbi:Lateral flagellar rod protein FlgF-like protein, partial [human gut metagenome]